ncbi:GDSL-type esterase/lipase family protein [Paenibacillus sp. N1-5-1-14]|uniref:GDSL-type esterase/lipase family protein n=1 Tax=Paenibacillus radicibacter TaxID=2972488 RepID=UPI002158DA95|nr:GDSL-type esterase/lipase family protein [Paenibacillus radicibacter]MCR8644245.1 GDSL-type esterase/lipase family protein [Paenibacillus radicibacter]
MLKKVVTISVMGLVIVMLPACGSNNGGQELQSAIQEMAADASDAKDQNYKTQFQDHVFLGDSIIEALSFHDVLKEENVMGKAGGTALFALDDISDLVSRSPKQVYIGLGSDDILWPTEDPQKFSITNYAKLLDNIKEKLPGSKITILSVTPVTIDAEKAEPRYKSIKSYNEALKELAELKKVEYLDLTQLVEKNITLFDKDGIHFKAEFYPKLLQFIQEHTR